MPTIDRIGKLRVVIYPNDHRPAHVHVIGPKREAIFMLKASGVPENVIELNTTPVNIAEIEDGAEEE